MKKIINARKNVVSVVTYLDYHRQVFSVRVIFILEVPEYLKNKI